MMKLFILLFTSLTIMNMMTCGKTSYIKIEDQSAEPIIINEGNIIIYNRGPRTGKSIFKYVKAFHSKEEYKSTLENFEKIKKDFSCNITEKSIVCLIFGNEIVNLSSRKVEEDKSSAIYRLTVNKFKTANNLSIEIKIVSNVESIDKDLLGIVGESKLIFLQ